MQDHDTLAATGSWPASSPDGIARRGALQQYAAYAAAPTARIEFRSRGRLLLRGPLEQVLPLARTALQSEIETCYLVCPPADAAARETPPKLPAGVHLLQGTVVTCSGHLGDFHLQCQVPSQSAAQETVGLEVDLVLDLASPPLFTAAVPPLGYTRVDAAAQASEALTDLSGLVGLFEKPKFFNYDAGLCAHGRSGISACRRCLDTCPTGAITSLGDRIKVDPFLCQGAGSCATACPAGAITYRYPDLADSLTRLRQTLKAWRKVDAATAPTVLFHDGEAGRMLLMQQQASLAERVLPLAVEEIGSVGMDIWLAALAYGAAQVGLLTPPDLPASVAEELATQLRVARALLDGMGHDPELLQRVEAPQLAAFGQSAPAAPVREPADFAGLDEKRNMLRLAIEHLQQFAPAPPPVIPLPQGAPFGEALVDAARCTLCMACVSQCPGKALQAGGEAPQLRFIEANCLQCGMCVQSCPEQAIRIAPRYLLDANQRRAARVLHEEAPFLCVTCGTPFATRSMIERISQQMARHPMFQGSAARRLKMCEDCRVKDMMQENSS